jgi:hypothetical protein
MKSSLAFLGFSITMPFFLSAPANAAEITCTPINAGVYSNRVHVKCQESFSGITYFAVPASNTNTASRVLDVITSAITSGKKVAVQYTPSNLSGSTFGCLNSDCRVIDAIFLLR